MNSENNALSIANTTKDERQNFINDIISISFPDLPSEKALALYQEYVNGLTELDVVTKTILNWYLPLRTTE